MDEIRAAALRFLVKRCAKELEQILRSTAAPEEHLGLPLSIIALADCEPQLVEALYARPLEVLSLLDDAAVQAQSELKALLEQQAAEQQRRNPDGPDVEEQSPQLNVLDNVHVRLVGLPSSLDPRPNPLRPPLSRVGCAQLHQLLSVTGNVVRGGPVRMWESNQVYECGRCKGRFSLKCSLEGGGAVDIPDVCPLQRTPPCTGNKYKKVPGVSIYSGFQEIRLQAATACLGLGEPPASLTVVLQDELADSVRPGDCVEVVGVLVPRWLSIAPGQRCELELVLVANNLAAVRGRSNNNAAGAASGGGSSSGGMALEAAAPTGPHPAGGIVAPAPGRSHQDLAPLFEDFWRAHAAQPLLGRNKILAGVCSGVAGLLPVKLAALLVLVGGVARRDEGGTHIRGELHLLLIGDPGTGKSQMMKWACQASPGRAVLTTGRGSSGAGLTVSAVREGSSWALEAGALVLADGGLCCIDEFDGIRPTERAVVHEAMEQQTVHVAKAGLVTSLSTRTAIIGAINPRPGTTLTCGRPLTEVTGLEGPLLSRFDLVLLLADPRHPEWDRVVAGHVLARRALAALPVTAAGDERGGDQPGRLPALPGPALPPDLKAPLPEPCLVADEGPLQPAGMWSGLQGGDVGDTTADDCSQLTIAQRVALRLTGSAMRVVTSSGSQPAGRQGQQGGTQGDARVFTGMTVKTSQHSGPSSTIATNTTGGTTGGTSGGSGGSAWSLEVIRAYITWVRGRPPPVMSPEAERVLVAYYGAMRRAEERTAARSTIRALESLIRVSQAHARLVCSGRVLLQDAVVAVTLADTSLQLLHIPGGDNVTCARFPADPDAEMLSQQRVVLTGLGLTDLLPHQHHPHMLPPASPPY